MSYEPQVGTIPARVIAHLKTLPPGAELSSAALGEVLGQDAAAVSAALAYPRDQGGIRSRRAGRVNFWSLPREEDEAQAQRDPVPDTGPIVKAAPSPAWPQQPQAGEAPGDQFRAALWNDGTLHIDLGYLVIDLNPARVSQLRRLLSGVAP